MGIVDRFVKSNALGLLLGVISCTAACGVLLPTPVFAQGADTPVALDLPAQPLGTALNSLAVQANLQIFFEQDPVAGLESPAINGTMTPKQALHILLAHTTLAYAQNADGTLVVSPTPKVAARRPAHKPTPVAEAPAAPPAPVAAAPVLEPQTVRDIEGPWMLRARALYLAPRNKSDAFEVPGPPPSLVPQDGANSNDRWAPELDAEYFFTSHWSAELALNIPQVHDLLLHGAALGGSSGRVGGFRLMPDFLTVKYGFLPEQAFRPYVGVGVNVTSIYAQQATPFTMSKTTAGPAAQAGFDIRLSDHWSVNADVKWARSRPAVDFDGQNVGHLKLDPVLFGVGIGYRFGGSPPPAPAAVIAPAPAPIPAPAPAPPPMDSDGDGVPDYLDKCPGTPAGLKVDANGCEIQELVLTGVTFETASAKLTPESSEQLARIVAVLRLRPNSKTEIHGYTDNRGSDAYNQELSERRASSVVEYLVEHGIAGPGLSARGFGKANPVASNETAEGRAQNRRVTVEFSRPVPRQ
jgi:outer membrane protein W/outer membrane protein OmpA-like peptidoglycan-associated protein